MNLLHSDDFCELTIFTGGWPHTAPKKNAFRRTVRYWHTSLPWKGRQFQSEPHQQLQLARKLHYFAKLQAGRAVESRRWDIRRQVLSRQIKSFVDELKIP
jgi:hypothetical protein